MRHRVSGKKLSRTRNQRKALFKGLVSSLIIHGRIKTTEAKAKAVQSLVEKLVSKAKEKNLHVRRQITAVVHNKKLVSKLVDEIAPRFLARKSGFTRILKLERRRGDQAKMVELSFVEEDKGKEKGKAKEKKKEKEERKKK